MDGISSLLAKVAKDMGLGDMTLGGFRSVVPLFFQILGDDKITLLLTFGGDNNEEVRIKILRNRTTRRERYFVMLSSAGKYIKEIHDFALVCFAVAGDFSSALIRLTAHYDWLATARIFCQIHFCFLLLLYNFKQSYHS